jgi:hypothetical protein
VRRHAAAVRRHAAAMRRHGVAAGTQRAADRVHKEPVGFLESLPASRCQTSIPPGLVAAKTFARSPGLNTRSWPWSRGATFAPSRSSSAIAMSPPDDLHGCPRPGRPRRAEPARPAMTRLSVAYPLRARAMMTRFPPWFHSFADAARFRDASLRSTPRRISKPPAQPLVRIGYTTRACSEAPIATAPSGLAKFECARRYARRGPALRVCYAAEDRAVSGYLDLST